MRKYFILFLILILLYLTLACQSNNKESIVIHVKSLPDSTDLSFCTLLLFLDNHLIVETLTDIHGFVNIEKSDQVKKIFYRYAGHYPKLVQFSELRHDTLVFLIRSSILDETAGMGVDTLLLQQNDFIESQIFEWQKDK